MTEVEIRKATLKDLEAIRKLNQKLFKYDYENFDNTIDCEYSFSEAHKKDYEKNITSPNNLTLVAIVNRKIVGYIVGSIDKAENYRKLDKIAELGNMLILKEYRNKGIGRKLVDELIRWAKSKGMIRIKVIASCKNIKAINFYKENGFFEYDLILEKDL